MLKWTLVLLVLGCNSSLAQKSKRGEKSMGDVSLDWSLKVTGGKLHVDYTLTNHAKKPFLVRDVMVVSDGKDLVPAPDAIVVVRGAAANEARFVRGDVSPDSKVNIRYPPGLRPLPPGQTVSGSAVVPLPVKAWHPYGEVQDLAGPVKQAVLEVQIYPGDIEQTSTVLPSGINMKWPKPTGLAPLTLHSGPKPIPTSAQ
jgi:hypothetical protein